jgi:hypothetical protein
MNIEIKEHACKILLGSTHFYTVFFIKCARNPYLLLPSFIFFTSQSFFMVSAIVWFMQLYIKIRYQNSIQLWINNSFYVCIFVFENFFAVVKSQNGATNKTRTQMLYFAKINIDLCLW